MDFACLSLFKDTGETLDAVLCTFWLLTVAMLNVRAKVSLLIMGPVLGFNRIS